MKQKTQIRDENQSVAIYNVAVPECIAIFKEVTCAGKYLRPSKPSVEASTIRQRINTKAVSVSKNVTGLKLAFRKANPKQIEQLGDADYILLVDYIPKVPTTCCKTYESTRMELAIIHGREGKGRSKFYKKKSNS